MDKQHTVCIKQQAVTYYCSSQPAKCYAAVAFNIIYRTGYIGDIIQKFTTNSGLYKLFPFDANIIVNIWKFIPHG